MAIVIHRETLELRTSVHEPDYDPQLWIINPTLPDAPRKYWKIDGDIVLEMNTSEKAAVDAAEEAREQARLAAKAELDAVREQAVALYSHAQTIIDGIDGASTAQVKAAIKRLAQNQQTMLRGLYRAIGGE